MSATATSPTLGGESAISTSSIIAGYGQAGVGAAATPAPARAATTKPAAGGTEAAATVTGDQVTLSPAAQRMIKARDNLASRPILPPADAAKEWQRLMGDATVLTAERPAADRAITALETSDPDHAATAKQACAYVADSTSGGKRVATPFASMDRVSLTAIATDEAGLYAPDERDAAAREIHVQQQTWVTANIQGTGVGAGFYTEAKRQYGLLSPLERSFYPPDYPDQMQKLADQRQAENPDPFWWMNGDAGEAADPVEIVRRANATAPPTESPA